MTDLFDEVGEDLRRERLKRIWQSYGALIIGAAVLLVLGVAGWRGYETWRDGQAAEAGALFRSALQKAEEGDHAVAADALVAFSSGAPGDYPLLARLRAASERAAAGETDTALSIFEATAADDTVPAAIRDLARVRAAMIAVDREDLAAIRARVAGLDGPDAAYRHAARELVAVAALKAEAWDEARTALEALTGDPELPADFAQRARILEDIVRAEIGDKPAAADGAGS
jgi:hypothetical protein